MALSDPQQRLAYRMYVLGQRYAGGEPAKMGGETPVFDRASEVPKERDSAPAATFSRTDRDRQPGKPLPPEATGDPHPDRLARAEALRQALLRSENRYRIPGSSDRIDVLSYRARGPQSRTETIETPRGAYLNISKEEAALEARRGSEVLYFYSVQDAVRCLRGSSTQKHEKDIQNAAGGITKSAFGWEWTRLKSLRGSNR